MQTSYFAKYKGDHGVCIAIRAPKGVECKCYPALAPKNWFLRKFKEDLNEDFYTARYTELVLDKLDPKEVYKDLGPDAVLLCWEGSGKFCHRHIVARWLEKHLNITIKEVE